MIPAPRQRNKGSEGHRKLEEEIIKSNDTRNKQISMFAITGFSSRRVRLGDSTDMHSYVTLR